MKGRGKGRRGGSNCSNLEWIDGFGRAQITQLHRHIKAGCQTSIQYTWHVATSAKVACQDFRVSFQTDVLYSARMSFNARLKWQQVKLRHGCFCVKPETTITSGTKASRSISIAQARGWYLYNTSNHQLVKESCDTASINQQMKKIPHIYTKGWNLSLFGQAPITN